MNGIQPIEACAIQIYRANPALRSWREYSAAAKFAGSIVDTAPDKGVQQTIMQCLYLGSQAAVIDRRSWNPKSLRRGQRIITQNTITIFLAGVILDEYMKCAKNFAKRTYGNRDEPLTGETNIVPIQGSQFMITATDTAKRVLAQMRAAKRLNLAPTLSAVERVVEQELGMLPQQIRTAVRASYRASLQTLPHPTY